MNPSVRPLAPCAFRLWTAGLLLLAAGPALAASAPPPPLLLHWNFDEGRGDRAQDRSGSGLHGTVKAPWAASPSGQAVSFDGTTPQTVTVLLPEDRRFGRDSWTFMAWLKPTQLEIADRQNQRRVFSFGVYPDANIVVDVTGEGRLSPYLCYKTAAGNLVSAGATSHPVKAGEWSHVVVVCDRTARRITCYVNGFPGAPSDLPADFEGDFTLGGNLSIGSGWHNYWGLADEVKVFRAALPRPAVRREFERLRDTFKPVLSRELVAAERRETLAASLDEVAPLWSAGDFAAVRKRCAAIIASPEATPQLRSYAHLRLAQSHVAEGKPAAARREYDRIAAATDYPEVHRAEARECSRELDREARGLPPRDPAASRSSIPPAGKFTAEIFVGPRGQDSGDGTRARPFASLNRARDQIRTLREQGLAGAIAVTALPGEYPMAGRVGLNQRDSGTAAAPVVYRAEKPGTAVFYGGLRLTGFVAVTNALIRERLPAESRDRVLQCDLRARGLTDFGRLQVRGFGQPPSPPTLELYFNGRPMTLARWPNEGFTGIRKLVDGGSKAAGRPSVFEYDSDRPARWTQAPDGWIFGYFRYLWADATLPIGVINPTARTLATAEAYHYGGGMTTEQGITYYAFNLLEELDAPGEWYLDRTAGILYFLPPSDPAQATIELGRLASPLVVLKNAAHIRLEGLVFDLARHDGLVLDDCTNCLVAGCTFSRLAGNGVSIQGGSSNTLFGCDIRLIGRRGSEVLGGDRATLTPGGHVVENCQIHEFGRIDRTYTPAIQLEGVGHRVAHNLLYDGPSSVMRIEGNDHVIEFNDVHSAVRESDDQGAMELFGNPTYRGVVFRHNRFRNVGKTGAEAAVHGQAALRLDDAISGMVIYGNVFVRSANGNFGAIQMNSGRDNIIDNNLFVDCAQGISGGWYENNTVWRGLRTGRAPAGVVTNALYQARYPAMRRMLDNDAVNHVWRNVFFHCGRPTTGNRAHLDLLENGDFPETDPGFVNAAAGDFRLPRQARLFHTVGFRPIPVTEIGLYEHPSRASWPVETTPVPLRDWRPARKLR